MQSAKLFSIVKKNGANKNFWLYFSDFAIKFFNKKLSIMVFYETDLYYSISK